MLTTSTNLSPVDLQLSPCSTTFSASLWRQFQAGSLPLPPIQPGIQGIHHSATVHGTCMPIIVCVCVCVCGITCLEPMVTRATVRSNAVLPLHLRKQGTLHIHVVKEMVYHPDKHLSA